MGCCGGETHWFREIPQVLGHAHVGLFSFDWSVSTGRQIVLLAERCSEELLERMICFAGVELEYQKKNGYLQHLAACAHFVKGHRNGSEIDLGALGAIGGTIAMPFAPAISSSPPCSISCLAAAGL